MFEGCTKLVEQPRFQEDDLIVAAPYSFYQMFKGCTALYGAYIPAINSAEHSFQSMYEGCVSLTEDEFELSTVAAYCCDSMFKDCTSLEYSPYLGAETLVTGCYRQMFYGCSSLNEIDALFTTTPGVNYTDNWVYGVAEKGTFFKPNTAEWDVTGVHGVPEGWEISIIG